MSKKKENVTRAKPGLRTPEGVVGGRCDSIMGHHYCVTHNVHFASNLQKDIHVDGGAKHVIAWICTDHGIETP